MPELLSAYVDNTVIIALLLFSAMVSCVLLVYIITKSRSGQVMAFFISGQILVLVWTVFYIFERIAPSVEIRWIIVCVEYFPLAYVGYVFMHFSYAYTRHKTMSKKWFYISLILPTFNYIAAISNPLHKMFYREFRLDGEVFGPLTYLLMITTFVYLILGAIFFLSKRHVINLNKQRQSMYFIIAITVPVIVHGLHTAGIFNVGFTISLLFIPFSILLFIVSVLKYQFLDVLPIAINETIDSMNEGMIVVDKLGQIIDHNDSFFKKMFGITLKGDNSDMAVFVNKLEKYALDCGEIESLRQSLASSVIEDVLKGTIHAKNLFNKEIVIYYAIKPILDQTKVKMATLITFFDMTEIYELSHELELKNQELTEANTRIQSYTRNIQQLSMETERNTIMADIHDTLGHSMMELLALIEVADLMMEQGQDRVIDTMDEALVKGRKSLDEIRDAVSRYKKMGGIS